MKILKILGNKLYCYYPGQTNPQDCYIELDCKYETLSASYNAEIGNAVPFSVYHGHEQRSSIPCLTEKSCNNLLEEIRPLAERVIEGYNSEWNGHNNIAHFNEDAKEAIEEIEEICSNKFYTYDESDIISACDVETWMENETIGANLSDDDLSQMVAKAECNLEDNQIIDGDIEEYVEKIRKEERIEVLEELFDNMNAIKNYKKISDEPMYIVKFNNGRCADVSYNSSGKIKWTRNLIRPENLSFSSIGKAIATKFYQDKYKILNNVRRDEIKGWIDGTLKADDYLAAKCEAVPEIYRKACKEKVLLECEQEIQEAYHSQNKEYFLNKRVREEILNKIKKFKEEIKELEKSLPVTIEPERISMGSNSAACKYFNLTGKYPEITL